MPTRPRCDAHRVRSPSGCVAAAAITPHFQDHGRTFSTTFNFDDHASVGKRFGPRRGYEMSARVEHFSNGGIRNPNPGQTFGQVRFARHF